MAHIEFDTSNWSEEQINGSLIIPSLDPDEVIKFFGRILDEERIRETNETSSYMDLFDPDLCPERYLPYLAETVGLVLDKRDSIPRQRLQIKSAVTWYKEKGKESSFDILFHSLGFQAFVRPLYINCEGDVTTDGNLPGYVAHARIDVDLIEIPHDGVALLPNDIDRILRRMEEVRPIHVLLRRFFAGKVFDDEFPIPTDDDLDNTLGLDFQPPDVFRLQPVLTGCGIAHFYGARTRIQHDGIIFCDRSGTRINEFTGVEHTKGDPYEEVPTLITRGEAVETFHDGFISDRTGTLLDTNGRPYFHDGISSWKYDRSCAGDYSTDFLEITVENNILDPFLIFYFHDGAITKRDGSINRSGSGTPIDVLNISFTHEIIDNVDVISDNILINMQQNIGTDNFGNCTYYHDGTIKNRIGGDFIYRPGSKRVNWDDPNLAWDTEGVFYDGTGTTYKYCHDGEIVARDGTVTDRGDTYYHDGTITHRGIPNAILRNSATPLGDCNSETGDELVVSGNLQVIDETDLFVGVYSDTWDETEEWDNTGMRWDGDVVSDQLLITILEGGITTELFEFLTDENNEILYF